MQRLADSSTPGGNSPRQTTKLASNFTMAWLVYFWFIVKDISFDY